MTSSTDRGSGGFWAAAAWYTVGTLAIQAANFIAQPVFANLMTPAEIGLVSGYLFWMTLMGLLIGLQLNATLNNALTTFGAAGVRGYVSTVVRLYALPTALLIAVFLVAPGFWEVQLALPRSYLLLAIANGVVFAIGNLAASHAVAMGRRRRFLALSASNTLGAIAIGLVLVLLKPEDRAMARVLGYLVAGVVVALGVALRSGRPGPFERRHVPFALAIALPLLVHEVLFLVANQSNRVFLLRLSGEAQTGIFSFAFSMGNIAAIAAIAINSAWTPWYFARTAAGDDEAVRVNGRRLTLLFGLGVGAVTLVSPDVIMFLAGPPYWPGARIIPLFILSGLLTFTFNFAANYVIFRRRTSMLLGISAGAVAISVGLNLLLIPQWGIVGAALATVASTTWLAGATMVVDRFVLRSRNLPYGTLLATVALASSAVAVTYAAFDLPVVRLAAAAAVGVATATWAGRLVLASRRRS
ncbi:MAG: lipopolysaccharide biosynthesis protein [Lacisediminihabitans sp.]